jgi:hypothetical protein
MDINPIHRSRSANGRSNLIFLQHEVQVVELGSSSRSTGSQNFQQGMKNMNSTIHYSQDTFNISVCLFSDVMGGLQLAMMI